MSWLRTRSVEVLLGLAVSAACAHRPPPEAHPTPAFEPAGIRAVIQTHAGEIDACYEAALSHRPNLHGRVAVKLLLDGLHPGEGVVREAVLTESSVSSPALESCVLARVRSWTFPRTGSPGTAVFTYPFVFQKMGE